MLVLLVLSPSLSSAKMIKTPEGGYINENYIHSIIQEDKDYCSIYYMREGNIPAHYALKMNCEKYMKKMGIEFKEMKK